MLGTIYGDDACGNCTDAHSWFKDAKSKSQIPIHYSVTDIDSSEAKKISRGKRNYRQTVYQGMSCL